MQDTTKSMPKNNKTNDSLLLTLILLTTMNEEKNKPTPAEVVDAVLAKNQDKQFDVNGDGKVDIKDVTAAIEHQLEEHQSSPANEFNVNGVKFSVVKVEGGTFMMGAARADGFSSTIEKPQHEVTLDSFKIAKTPVTQGLWIAVMGTNPSIHKGDQMLPVENVSWDDVQTFINRLNAITGKKFRLPTEAEWEYAARGGNKDVEGYFAGGALGDVAWYADNSGNETHHVQTKQPNELGIYDMSGNVDEWVNDWYTAYTAEAQTNPKGKENGTLKVFRGGNYGNIGKNCRVNYRYMAEPAKKAGTRGFRLAL